MTFSAEYVPKYLAVVMIGQDPEKYGFRDSSEVRRLPAVEVPGPLPLAEIEKISRLTVEALRAVNPHLSQRTPPGKVYELWVPSQQAEFLSRAGAELAKISSSYPRQLASGKYFPDLSAPGAPGRE